MNACEQFSSILHRETQHQFTAVPDHFYFPHTLEPQMHRDEHSL